MFAQISRSVRSAVRAGAHPQGDTR
jgi:hypothetical protein